MAFCWLSGTWLDDEPRTPARAGRPRRDRARNRQQRASRKRNR